MKQILIQGSGGTIGDVFLSSHPLVNYLKEKEKEEKEEIIELYAAIPTNTPDSIKDMYSRQKLLTNVFEIESVHEDVFLPFCKTNNFTPCLFLKSWQFYKNIRYQELSSWFDKPSEPTLSNDNIIIVHVTSSSNFNRPKIPHFNKYIQYIFDAGYTPVLIGTSKDEEYFTCTYPDIREKIPEDMWRFGKDTLPQTMSNIDISKGVFTFSSWSSIYGALCKKPVLELWNDEQWLFYNNTIKYLIGSPITLFQNHYASCPQYNHFDQSFKYMLNTGSVCY